MLKRLFFLLFFAVAGPSTAQEILYSAEEGFEMRTDDFAVVGRCAGKLYAYHRRGPEHRLLAYDDSLQKLATVVLDFLPERAASVRFVATASRMVVLYTESAGRDVVQYAASLDGDARLLAGPGAVDTVRPAFFNGRGFATAVSEGRHRILIYTTDDRDEHLTLQGTLLDDEGQVLDRPRLRYQGGEKLEPGTALVGEDGTLFLPAFATAGGKGYADRMIILQQPPGEPTVRATEVRLNELYAAPPHLRLDQSGARLHFAGFYSEKRTGSFDGVLAGYMGTADGTIYNRRTLAFDDRTRAATGGRSLRRAFNEFVVTNLVLRNDGGFVMVSEQQYVTARGSYTPGWGYYSFYYSPFMAPSVREYHYNDLFAASYDGDGNREWHAFVRKDQYSQEDGALFSSFALLNSGGSLHFLFNDFNRTRSVMQLATLDAAGAVTTTPLTAGQTRDDRDWLPRSSRQVASRAVMVPCLRRRGLSFARVVF